MLACGRGRATAQPVCCTKARSQEPPNANRHLHNLSFSLHDVRFRLDGFNRHVIYWNLDFARAGAGPIAKAFIVPRGSFLRSSGIGP